ncbi:MAG TPA: TonB-dependent receptor [Bacteroidales bacterium]|nr:TonB-dependent receptor [Bacteroidales bacterium]HPS71185.1 TonB-dependent receptor [Bacteroidales bacterium]
MTKNSKFLFIFISFLIISYQFSFGQENKNYSVSGKIKDLTNKQPIEFASVAIYKTPDTVLVTGTITNAKGEFVLKNLSSGKFIIKSSFMGYHSVIKNVEIVKSSLILSEPIYLTKSALSLNEVQVTTTRNEKQITIEMTKINVAQNISSVSGNIIEVLKSQSSVSIDGENNIYLRGNKNILILIDGVPTTVSALNLIPASNVENIEIITNPDAKYDAEGTGGIINIVTKRQNISGISGAASLNYGIYNRINGGLSLNYSKGIWDIGINYNGKYEKSDIQSYLTRELYTQNIFVDQEIKSTQRNPTHTLSLLLNAKPTKKDIFSFGFKYMSPNLNTIQTITGQQINDLLPAIYFNRKNDITFSRKTIESTLSYKKIFEKNKNELSFDASFSRTKGSRPAEYYIENILLQKSSGGGTPTNVTIQVDYLKSLFKTGKIEFGLKGFSRWNNFIYYFHDLDTNSNQWNLNPAFSNNLEHHEYIYSSYLMYSDSLFKKVYYKIGARVEYNTSEIIQKSINYRGYKEYVFPFPYLLIKYNINKNKNVALSVNRRITRPTYPQINPFINVIDQMTYETGNKSLKPEILDKMEFNYSFIKEKFQFKTNIFYSLTKDFITQISMLSVPDKLILTYVNGDRQHKIGSDFDITYKLVKYLSINPGVSIFYTKSIGQFNEIDLSTNNLAWTGNIKIIIKPEKKTEIQLFLNYNSPIELPQFYLSEIYYADISVKRTFFDNKLSVSLTLTDIFNTRNWEINSDNAIYKLVNYSKSETRILWIGLTYNFNSFKAGKSQKNGDSESDGGIFKLGQ